MGRKRWWRGGSELLVLFILHHAILGDGDVGCLFSKNVCNPRTETCYNDLAFGRCLPLYGDIDIEDYYQYNFNTEELEVLRLQLERLRIDGYKWMHPYTQCVIQTSLYNFRHRRNYDPQLCLHFSQHEHFGLENGISERRVPTIAIVKFTPNNENSVSDFANELYYPSGGRNRYIRGTFYDNEFFQSPYKENDEEQSRAEQFHERRYVPKSYNEYDSLTDADDFDDYDGLSRKKASSFDKIEGERLYRARRHPYNLWADGEDAIESIRNALQEEKLTRQFAENRSPQAARGLSDEDLEFLVNDPLINDPSINDPSINDALINDPSINDALINDPSINDASINDPSINDPSINDASINDPSINDASINDPSINDASINDPSINDASINDPPVNDASINDPPVNDPFLRNENEVDPDSEYEKQFSRKYKHPRQFSSNEFNNAEFLVDNVKRNSKSVDYEDKDYENVRDETELPESDAQSKESGIYTEGGLIQPGNDGSNLDQNANTYGSLFDNDLNDLLWRRELAGFKRRERLDVKKPGPPFSTNNYAFKTQSPSTLKNEDLPDLVETDRNNEVLLSPLVKKEISNNGQHSVSNNGQPSEMAEDNWYKNVDLDHVYMEFQQPFHTWSEGEHVVKEVGKLLELTQGTLKDIRVGRAEVTFKVVQNNKNYNAFDVVNHINDIRGKLRETLGAEVIRAGIGDKAKLPATLEVTREGEMSSSLFGAIVGAGIAAAAAAATVTLITARRHAKSRAKLAGLANPDPEASKDYQDLCRARMHAKQPTDKPESPRITSLTRENESNILPSNRSSTSSWGDEPALSNMDISTGHMVLSYMEDHLKNKDRLDQEWAALCAYEADPCSTEIAESEANIKQNRPGAALPYDHSRVVLNELTSANNSNYINASTITDHDPRNPAYIATQGPLPQTTADFWQMVWEQGSVVIVMLTRLTEEGVAMCHRYWPEEGSELYHIYEVHLVSEHVWCDDYLVRSFYLKNLRTSDTRTVTQFHFLSWPENSVPHSTKALLEFRRKVNKSYRGRSCPIVVHCSDGAGRTGTYTLIDMVLNRMVKGAKEIDIAATLEHIRDQRPDMVATKQQFEFVLMAVAEEVHAILKALPVPPAEKPPAALPGSNSSSKADQ